MMYRDKTGRLYCVNAQELHGLRMYKAFYKTPRYKDWYAVNSLEWRRSCREAEADLAAYAGKHNMEKV